ncbi:phytoene desaturase family protein [Sandaracinus amylolyticus]|uniref:phytoene desaturase family protein n=1 Tax=Sandaracinus amylolyticus TaxID=927083 RepID=UPI001F3939F6|nr:NAD(P)/FAD-dependent oxidoreductase [Sandaracinus amylolyticus]UJR81884.1 Carotenoid cis-trans isomerase [Sandaracinus amylolyticus]
MLPEECDVVVIGAGIGGLTSAALLAKAGHRVCVLEMADSPGGYLAGFRRQKFLFDTGIHWLNQCGPGGAVRRVLDIVGPGAPETPMLRKIRRYKGQSFDYLLTDDPDALRDRIVADVPDQARGIERFFAASKALGSALTGFADHMRIAATMSLLEKATHGIGMASRGLRARLPGYLKWSTEDAFDELFEAPVMARIFCSEERLLSCILPLGWAYEHDYQCAPRGGARELWRFLVRAIRSWQGQVVCRTRVERIHVESGRATGVSYVTGTRRGSIRAKYVLAACDQASVYERMLPPGSVDQEWVAKLREAEIGDSHVSVFLGLDRPAEDLGFGSELYMLTRDDVSRRDHNAGDPTRVAITALAASVRDPSLAPEGMGTLRLCVAANIRDADHWKTGPGLARGPEYAAYKNAYADILIERVERALSPRLREHVVVREVATPITHLRYTGNRDGSIVGTKASRANLWSGVAHYFTPVRNLIFSGQWAELGGGVPIAVKAGVNAALLVMKSEHSRAFRSLVEAIDGTRAVDDLDPALLQPLPSAPTSRPSEYHPRDDHREDPGGRSRVGERAGAR